MCEFPFLLSLGSIKKYLTREQLTSNIRAQMIQKHGETPGRRTSFGDGSRVGNGRPTCIVWTLFLLFSKFLAKTVTNEYITTILAGLGYPV